MLYPLLPQPCGMGSPRRLETELPSSPGCSQDQADKGRGREELMKGRDSSGPPRASRHLPGNFPLPSLRWLDNYQHRLSPKSNHWLIGVFSICLWSLAVLSRSFLCGNSRSLESHCGLMQYNGSTGAAGDRCFCTTLTHGPNSCDLIPRRRYN